jgi:hypothetical protein
MVGPVVAVDKIHSRGKKTKLGHLKSVFHLQRPFIFSFAIENYQEKMVGLGVPFSVRSRFFAVGNCWFGFRVFVRCPDQKNYLGFRRVVVNLPYVIKVRNLIEWKRYAFPARENEVSSIGFAKSARYDGRLPTPRGWTMLMNIVPSLVHSNGSLMACIAPMPGTGSPS